MMKCMLNSQHARNAGRDEISPPTGSRGGLLCSVEDYRIQMLGKDRRTLQARASLSLQRGSYGVGWQIPPHKPR